MSLVSTHSLCHHHRVPGSLGLPSPLSVPGRSCTPSPWGPTAQGAAWQDLGEGVASLATQAPCSRRFAARL